MVDTKDLFPLLCAHYTGSDGAPCASFDRDWKTCTRGIKPCYPYMTSTQPIEDVIQIKVLDSGSAKASPEVHEAHPEPVSASPIVGIDTATLEVCRERAAGLRSGRNHLSNTQIAMYATCPYRYYLRYICDIKTPPGSALRIGKVVHANIERALVLENPDSTMEQRNAVNESATAEAAGMDQYDLAKAEAVFEAFYPTVRGNAEITHLKSELELSTTLAGIGFVGVIDRFNYETSQLTEYKTVGDLAEWSSLEVMHQLAIYLHAYPDTKSIRVDLLGKPKCKPKTGKNPESAIDYRVRCLEELTASPKKYFASMVYYPKEIAVARYIAEVEYKVGELLRGLDSGMFAHNVGFSTCRWCDWKRECVQRMGKP